MSLQTIINAADTIKINRRRQVGVQYSRSEIAYTSETATRNPWRFDVEVSKLFRYEQARSLLESIDQLDRNVPETISFASNANLDFMFAYQGEATAGELSNILVGAFTGTNLVLKNLTGISAGTKIFGRGDFIQIADSPYPFTATADLYRTTATTQTLVVHRPNFISSLVVDKTLLVGNAVQFKFFCPNMPTYTIRPGGSTALVEFDTEFQLYEYTGDT
jgi:hypothetical protein